MQPGSLVQCITDLTPKTPMQFLMAAALGCTIPQKDEIYTVREVGVGANNGILLEEIVNEKKRFKDGFLEPNFRPEDFRELQPPMDLTNLVKETEPKGTLVKV